MKTLYENLLIAKEIGYWGVIKNKEKNSFTHILYIKKDKEIPLLEFETPLSTKHYDFSYPIKIYIDVERGFKGCLRFTDDSTITGLEEFKKKVLNKVISAHSDIVIEMGFWNK